jgi:hypothetical protein
MPGRARSAASAAAAAGAGASGFSPTLIDTRGGCSGCCAAAAIP